MVSLSFRHIAYIHASFILSAPVAHGIANFAQPYLHAEGLTTSRTYSTRKSLDGGARLHRKAISYLLMSWNIQQLEVLFLWRMLLEHLLVMCVVHSLL